MVTNINHRKVRTLYFKIGYLLSFEIIYIDRFGHILFVISSKFHQIEFEIKILELLPTFSSNQQFKKNLLTCDVVMLLIIKNFFN